MIKNKNKAACCGCGACSQICPKQCIEMKSDSAGFLYPIVNKDSCINCGLCEKRCPILNTKNERTGRQDAFVAFHRDEQVRLSSSSGGIFSALAENVIKHGGIVFGATFDENFLVHHIGAERLEELEKFRGSKYLQSRTESCYLAAKASLEDGRPVLYSGTGCQIAGLKSFLGTEYPNLLTVDILCHGVPSPKLWKLYLKEQEQKHGASAQNVSFRDKVTGWKEFSLTIDFANGDSYSDNFRDDPYMQLFLKNICLRPSCHDCRFKTVYSQADITLGDCWGVEKYKPEMDNDEGTSVVMIHTDKGEKAYEKIVTSIVSLKADVQHVQQTMMYDSVKPHPHRERFLKRLAAGNNIDKLYDCLHVSLPEKTVRRIKKLLKEQR